MTTITLGTVSEVVADRDALLDAATLAVRAFLHINDDRRNFPNGLNPRHTEELSDAWQALHAAIHRHGR
jgi:hypothetical protein